MFRRIWSVCLLASLACLCSPASLPAQDNPFKKADVGDWVSYEMKMNFGGQNITTTMKQTLASKTEKEATLKVEINSQGRTFNQEQKIPLDKPFDPTAMMNQGQAAGADVQKMEETDDNVTVGGKSYKAKRIKMKINLKQLNQETTSTVWVSKDVPLTGLVKMEMDFAGQKMVMEMTGSGKAK